MEQKKIDRINFLAKKAKTPEGLTKEETEERAMLREEYLASIRANFRQVLDSVEFVEDQKK